MAISFNADRADADLALTRLIRDHAHPLLQSPSDFDPVLDLIGDRPIVLLGEATHGTHEFYAARSMLTRRLIEEKGFTALALEADWPDAIRINRFIRGHGSDSAALESLLSFQRFPMWMWRNSAFLDLVEWLWMHNRRESTRHQVSVFGLDIYSLYRSMHAVIRFLESEDSLAAETARRLYSCFDHKHQEPELYGRQVRVGLRPSCENAALEVLKRFFNTSANSGMSAEADERFFARQNAELVRSAESYYRNLFSPLVNTWNVRDQHMADTVERVREFLEARNGTAKIVIWAHNSHIGDDRATEMGWNGQVNIGQFLRERYPGKTYHLGFTTFEGTVTASSLWDSPPELKTVLPALSESYEALFHRTGLDAFFLSLTERELIGPLTEERLERAIGVIYSPSTERVSHYFQACLSEQFDGVIHFDRTREVEPLDRLAAPEIGEPSTLQI